MTYVEFRCANTECMMWDSWHKQRKEVQPLWDVLSNVAYISSSLKSPNVFLRVIWFSNNTAWPHDVIQNGRQDLAKILRNSEWQNRNYGHLQQDGYVGDVLLDCEVISFIAVDKNLIFQSIRVRLATGVIPEIYVKKEFKIEKKHRKFVGECVNKCLIEVTSTS